MAFEVIFLATGGSVPRDRFLNATLIRSFDKNFLIDCGDGVQYPLLGCGKHLGDQLSILISHEHVDHIGGLGGLLNTLDLRHDTEMKIEIFGGSLVLEKILFLLQMVGTLEWLKIHYNVLKSDIIREDKYIVSKDIETDQVRSSLDFPINVPMSKRWKQVASELAWGWLQDQANRLKSNVLWEDSHMVCKSFGTYHTRDSYGFIFEQKEHRKFLDEKAEELRIPKGKIRGQLANEQEVLLPDGRIIKPEMVLSSPIEGKKVVLLTDTVYHPNLINSCKGANCLIAESTYLESNSKEANEYKHLTAKQAGALANEAGVDALYLNHISKRYKDEEILNEARQEFSNVFVTKDGQEISI